ncbi:MAG: type II secretion system F family protein [Vampirovibrio sp.]|nr:type II secretion system F family protein [Vampirovibrio sp.]
MLLVILGLIFIVSIAIAFGVVSLQKYMNPEPSLMQVRLSQLKEQHEEEEALYEYNNTSDLTRFLRGSGYSSEELGKLLEKYSFFGSLKRLIRQSGIVVPPDKFFIMFMAAPLAFSLFSTLILKNPLIGLACLTIPVVSIFLLVFKRNQRLEKFTKQLPDALAMLTSSLRAGHSFQSALSIVSTEMPDPMSIELGNVVNDMNLGIPVKEALNKMIVSLNSLPDAKMLATAILIQREAGGNLAEILDKLGFTIRERFKMKGQIASLTAQSTMTGYVMGLAPITLLGIMTVFMGDYVAPLYETEIGNVALGIGAVMQIIGFFIMKKIVEIRV